MLAPVIDLRCYLGLPDMPPSADTHIILAQVGGRLAGLIVDTVLDVLQLAAQQIIRPADILPIGLTETSLVIEGLFRQWVTERGLLCAPERRRPSAPRTLLSGRSQASNAALCAAVFAAITSASLVWSSYTGTRRSVHCGCPG